MTDRTCCIIVLFNPDLEKLARLLLSIKSQVDFSFIIDNTPISKNTSANKKRVLSLLNISEHEYIALNDNNGIAFAQNIGITKAKSNNYSNILFLDQDSEITNSYTIDLISQRNSIELNNSPIAAIGPTFIDTKTNIESYGIVHSGLRTKKIISKLHDKPFEVDYIISSGSLVRTKLFEKVGMMNEDLFIDWVDIEWCLRAKKHGFKCYKTPSVKMYHCIGDRTIKIVGRNINIHNKIRCYYIIRNATFLLRESHMGNSWRFITMLKIPAYILLYAITSENSIKSTALFCKAAYDGLIGKLGKVDDH